MEDFIIDLQDPGNVGAPTDLLDEDPFPSVFADQGLELECQSKRVEFR